MPAARGVELVVVGTSVLIVPLFVIDDNVPDKVYNAVISNVPPLVVVRIPLTTRLPPALSVLLVFSKVRLLYVPATTVCAPVVAP